DLEGQISDQPLPAVFQPNRDSIFSPYPLKAQSGAEVQENFPQFGESDLAPVFPFFPAQRRLGGESSGGIQDAVGISGTGGGGVGKDFRDLPLDLSFHRYDFATVLLQFGRYK